MVKSIKYLLFGIGIIFLGFLSCMIFKGEGGYGMAITSFYIPVASMIVGLFFLIKGLKTEG